jgi:hypothetical protein
MRSRVAHFLGTSKCYAHSIPKTDGSSTMTGFAWIGKVATKVAMKVAIKVLTTKEPCRYLTFVSAVA